MARGGAPDCYLARTSLAELITLPASRITTPSSVGVITTPVRGVVVVLDTSDATGGHLSRACVRIPVMTDRRSGRYWASVMVLVLVNS